MLAGLTAFATALASPDSAQNVDYSEESVGELLQFLEEEFERSSDSDRSDPPLALAFSDDEGNSSVDPDPPSTIQREPVSAELIPTPGTTPAGPQTTFITGGDSTLSTTESTAVTSTSEGSASETTVILRPPMTTPESGTTSIASPTTSASEQGNTSDAPTTLAPTTATPTTAASTTATPSTEASSTQAPRTTEPAPVPSSARRISPYDYRVNGEFDPATDLPSARARSAYNAWWTNYNDPASNYPYSPYVMFDALGKNNGRSLGAYSYSRQGGFYLASIQEMIRTTGDPAALNELVAWSQQLKTNLKDHDGRGYEYFQYYNPSPVGDGSQFYYSDTNFLEESLLAGTIAHMAWVMHQNRDFDPTAGAEADFWFAYLDQNWLPKWQARSTYGTRWEWTPPAELGMNNATGWSSPDNPQHNDRKNSFRAGLPEFNPNGIEHILPVRELGHPYIASAFQYYVMGEYFEDTGKTVWGTPNRTAADYSREAITRHDFWHRQTVVNADGSRDWWLFMAKQRSGLRSGGYSTHVSVYLNALHWERFGEFAKDSEMKRYAKVWINPIAPGDDVYDPGNVKTMTYFATSTGTDEFRLMFHSLFIPFDTSGELERLTNTVISNSDRHWIDGSQNKHHGAHYNGIINAELVRSLN